MQTYFGVAVLLDLGLEDQAAAGPANAQLSAERLEQFWQDLHASDPQRAYAAVSEVALCWALARVSPGFYPAGRYSRGSASRRQRRSLRCPVSVRANRYSRPKSSSSAASLSARLSP